MNDEERKEETNRGLNKNNERVDDLTVRYTQIRERFANIRDIGFSE